MTRTNQVEDALRDAVRKQLRDEVAKKAAELGADELGARLRQEAENANPWSRTLLVFVAVLAAVLLLISLVEFLVGVLAWAIPLGAITLAIWYYARRDVEVPDGVSGGVSGGVSSGVDDTAAASVSKDGETAGP